MTASAASDRSCTTTRSARCRCASTPPGRCCTTGAKSRPLSAASSSRDASCPSEAAAGRVRAAPPAAGTHARAAAAGTRAGNAGGHAGGHTAVAAAQLDLFWARLVRACHQGKAALSAGGGQVATSVVAPPARGRERAVPQTLARGWCKALPRAEGRQARPQDIIMSTYGCRVATAASGFRLRQQRLLWYAMQQVWCGRCARKWRESYSCCAVLRAARRGVYDAGRTMWRRARG